MKKMEVIFSKETQPSVSKTHQTTGVLSPPVQKLIQRYQDWLLSSRQKGEIAVIHVDEIASKVASLYEKIRKVVDWKEEHLIRRTAIERILKRRMISELSGFSLISNLKAKEIAEPLVLELIRGGHLPNDQIPQEKITQVEKILAKYIYILENNAIAQGRSPARLKTKVQFYHWILEIAACEIEEVLASPVKENALIDCMSELMTERIRIKPENSLTEAEKKTQVYIAVHRALFRLDAPIISYHLLRRRYPQWTDLSPSLLAEITTNIFVIQREVEKELNHPLMSEFFKICEKYDTLWLLLGDILDQLADQPLTIAQQIAQPEVLKKLIKEAYTKRLSTLKSRLFRMAVYSTLSIFISSGFSLFVVEVPLARLFYGRFNLLATIVDIMAPTVLMFLLVASVKPPPENNLQKVTAEIIKIVYQKGPKDIYELRTKRRKNLILNSILGFLYFLGCSLSLGITLWVFYWARIPPTSIVLDTMNIAVIVFAGLVIRQRAKELTIEEKTSLSEFSLDMLSVPVAKIGQWLSARWKEYNVVSVFFSALIDMPFLAFIEFIEGWSSFLKEKKAEIH